MTVNEQPLVGVSMGSQSDWETLRHAAEVLAEFGVPCGLCSASTPAGTITAI